MTETCTRDDRRRLGVTVGVQGLTERGWGGQGTCTGDDWSRQVAQRIRTGDGKGWRGGTRNDGDGKGIFNGTVYSEISIVA